MSELKQYGTLNISQSLFLMDQNLMGSGTQTPQPYDSDASVQQVPNSQFSANDLSLLGPYINQAHMANYYRDNPYNTLSFSLNYGVPTLGSPINPNLGAGSKPLNRFVPNNNQIASQQMIRQQQMMTNRNNVVPQNVDGVFIPNFMTNNYGKNLNNN